MNGRRSALAAATLIATFLAMELVAGPAVRLRLPLDTLPFRVGLWTGRVEPADQEFLARAQPEVFVNRQYRDAHGRAILFYAGYYTRQASRGQVQVPCYGECEVRRVEPILLHVGLETASVNSAVVVQNGVPMVVVFWYQHGDRVIANPYQETVELVKRALLHRRTDGAVVRVSAPLIFTTNEAADRATSFAALMMPLLRRHFPD